MKRHSLVKFVFKSACFSRKKNYIFKIHLFSFLSTKQTNDGIFLNKTWDNFNPNKVGLFERSFSFGVEGGGEGGGVNLTSPSYFKKNLSDINMTLYSC